MKGKIPFKTSLISPGGDSRRNLETAWMHSETSIIRGRDEDGWEASQSRQTLSLSSLMSRVQLYVYDLSNGLARQLSLSLTGKHIYGIWYASSVQWNHLLIVSIKPGTPRL